MSGTCRRIIASWASTSSLVSGSQLRLSAIRASEGREGRTAADVRVYQSFVVTGLKLYRKRKKPLSHHANAPTHAAAVKIIFQRRTVSSCLK